MVFLFYQQAAGYLLLLNIFPCMNGRTIDHFTINVYREGCETVINTCLRETLAFKHKCGCEG